MKNEPAYPVTPLFENGTNMTHSGLTKLEYFAAKALNGFISMNKPSEDRGKEAPEILAKAAVLCAKALIAELEKAVGDE